MKSSLEHRTKSSGTMLLGIFDFKLLGAGSSQASTVWLIFHLVPRWRLWQVMVWVQTDRGCLQETYLSSTCFPVWSEGSLQESWLVNRRRNKGLNESVHILPPVIGSCISLLAIKSLPAAKMEPNLLQIKSS